MDVESILNPISADDPCGPNLEYDAGFAELERASQGKPERQMGATIVPAEEPDWKVVEKLATALFGKSKDLRVAIRLTRARLRLGGIIGAAEGLAVLRGLFERYWPTVHPRLDPDDDNDPTMRVNILMELVDDPMLNDVRTTPIVSSRALGRFALKEFEIANGDVPPAAGTEPVAKGTLDGALKDADLAVLEQTLAAARSGRESLVAAEAFITEQVGAGNAPTFSKLTAMLRKIETALAAGVAKRQPGPAGSDGADEAGDAGGGGAAGAAGGGGSGRPRRGGGGPLTGDIGSRDDVVSAIDRICAYYAEYEPASPVPMFLERCKRLVKMSFLDIVRDLVPEAMTQVEVLKGKTETEGG